MGTNVQEIPVHVGQRLRDEKGRLWLVRDLLPLACVTGEAPWFVVRLDFRSNTGSAGSVVMSMHEFTAIARQATAERPSAQG
jgi:hypothetical protein